MQKCKIAERLAELRAAHGLTQSELALKLSISNKTISKWENGISTPDLPMLIELSRYYGVSTDALLGLEDEQDMIDLANKIIEKGLSVRDTENAVKRINESKEEIEEEEEKVNPQVKTHMKELERRAMSTLGRKVRISRSSRKKVVELTYDNDEDLEALLLSLCGEKIFAETVD